MKSALLCGRTCLALFALAVLALAISGCQKGATKVENEDPTALGAGTPATPGGGVQGQPAPATTGGGTPPSSENGGSR